MGEGANTVSSGVRRIRVLINPRSGMWWSFGQMLDVLEKHWDKPGVDLSYQFSLSKEDGQEKARRALADGADTILVIGGDGMVNSIGSVLIGHDAALGVIPAGSGNGFARHFGIPLNPERAALALLEAERRRIDVGTANGRPFFVTCSMAWDASLVRHFEKFPMRGILPYVLAAAYEFLEYEPQPFEAVLDGAVIETYEDPLVFTVANLTQFGGGAQIAPMAQPDDGYLELIVMRRRDAPKLLANLPRLFDGTLHKLPEVLARRFKRLQVRRARPAPIQLDGELVEAAAEVSLSVLPRALTVLAPWKGE